MNITSIKLVNKIKMFLNIFKCRFGFHKWEIVKWSRFKDKKFKFLIEQSFDRHCEYCGKKQTLKRPKKYHPTKYVWSD